MISGSVLDTRRYHHFEVAVVSPTISSILTRELKAFDEEGASMYLPVTVKNFYRSSEAAYDVLHIIEKIFPGKTKQECERLLGVAL